ncbi:MAG: YqaE/Pmp3 family membrane protein [Candidatus Cyclobacteriaceae bacterium M3_2C_046]
MKILDIILAIVLPPLAVFLRFGLTGTFWLNLILTLIGWIPGVIHAFYVLSKRTSQTGI